jgi:hypothetical protein
VQARLLSAKVVEYASNSLVSLCVGGSSGTAFDCSGFTGNYEEIQGQLARTASSLFNAELKSEKRTFRQEIWFLHYI